MGFQVTRWVSKISINSCGDSKWVSSDQPQTFPLRQKNQHDASQQLLQKAASGTKSGAGKAVTRLKLTNNIAKAKKGTYVLVYHYGVRHFNNNDIVRRDARNPSRGYPNKRSARARIMW
jgi:hypothetical protein